MQTIRISETVTNFNEGSYFDFVVDSPNRSIVIDIYKNNLISMYLIGEHDIKFIVNGTIVVFNRELSYVDYKYCNSSEFPDLEYLFKETLHNFADAYVGFNTALETLRTTYCSSV